MLNFGFGLGEQIGEEQRDQNRDRQHAAGDGQRQRPRRVHDPHDICPGNHLADASIETAGQRERHDMGNEFRLAHGKEAKPLSTGFHEFWFAGEKALGLAGAQTRGFGHLRIAARQPGRRHRQQAALAVIGHIARGGALAVEGFAQRTEVNIHPDHGAGWLSGFTPAQSPGHGDAEGTAAGKVVGCRPRHVVRGHR